MGIASLLPALKSIERRAHVSETYGGKSVCVDAYVWLHRGAYACSRELCEGARTTKHVEYFMNRARALRRANVRATYVFDGGRLPGKAAEEAQRRRTRSEALAKAKAHARNGNASAANECYARAVDITPEMAREVIEALEKEGFECLTAPYEADAQMAYLVKNGFVSGVITEDSDLIAHGCDSVFTKMAPDGSGIEIRFADLGKNRGMSFIGFTPDMFLEMCVLSGCDYLPSLSGVGLKKAHSLIRRFKTYTKVLRHMKFEGISVPKDYEARFEDALLTFKYCWVYCPKRMRLVHLNDPSGILDDRLLADLPRIIGAHHPPALAQAVANNEAHPMTLEAFTGPSNANRRRLAATAPSTVVPYLDPDELCEDLHRAAPAGASTSINQSAAIASFLRRRPEDDAQTYREVLMRDKPRETVEPNRMNRSFYAAMEEHDEEGAVAERQRRDSLDFPVGVDERANEDPRVVPDSVERPRQSHGSRLPKDISNVASRIVAETPIASTAVKRSPYFANVAATPKPITPAMTYAKIAKDSIDRVKNAAECEIGAGPSLKKRTERVPTRTTPQRVAKQSRTAPASNGRKSPKKRKSGDGKFWQMSLFESFAFEK